MLNRNKLSLVTGAAMALALGCAAVSVKMANADELVRLGLPVDVSVGSFQDGLVLGKKNGGMIAQRVYKKIIGRIGCAGLEQYQSVLSSVAANAKAPAGRGTKFTAGFYRGYVDAVRDSVKGARNECSALQFSDGTFPGEFFGGIFCQVAAVDPEALNDLGFTSIYDGWSSGKESLDGCVEAFQAVTADCVGATGIAAQLLGQAQTAACSDIGGAK